MSFRLVAALLTTIAGLALVPAIAGAHTDLRLDPGNVPLPPPTTFVSTTSHGFFLNAPGTGQLGCANASFDADVSFITSATSITGQMTAFTAQGCTDSFSVPNFTSCHLHNKVGLLITSTPAGGTVALTDPVLRCASLPMGACYFTSAVANGVYTNATSVLAYENVAYTPIAATSDSLGASCGTGGTWSVTFTHIVGGTANQTLTIRQ